MKIIQNKSSFTTARDPTIAIILKITHESSRGGDHAHRIKRVLLISAVSIHYQIPRCFPGRPIRQWRVKFDIGPNGLPIHDQLIDDGVVFHVLPREMRVKKPSYLPTNGFARSHSPALPNKFTLHAIGVDGRRL